jgi:hypothetical protein
LIGRSWPFKRGKFEELTVPCAPTGEIVLSPNGGLLILDGGPKGFGLRVFLFPAMETLNACQLPPLGTGTGKTLRFSPCGRLLAVVGSKAQVILSATTLSVLANFSIKYGCHVDFSPTDSLMAIGSWSAGEVFATAPYLQVCGAQDSKRSDSIEASKKSAGRRRR